MRWLRKTFDVGLPIVGMFLVFLAALGVEDIQLRIILILIGLLLIEVGVWKLANPLYPNERRFNHLRVEVDQFITLARELNAAALKARTTHSETLEDQMDSILASMRRSVDRMADVAGRDADEVEPEENVSPFRTSAFM